MAEKKQQKWYNSHFFQYVGQGLGIGAIVLAVTFGIRSCDNSAKNAVEIERIKSGYVLKKQDLNNNGQVEKFYEINGQKYFSVIDGKNLEDSLK